MGKQVLLARRQGMGLEQEVCTAQVQQLLRIRLEERVEVEGVAGIPALECSRRLVREWAVGDALGSSHPLGCYEALRYEQDSRQ